MNRRNLILGSVAALLIAVAVVYTLTRPKVGADLPREISANCACLACKQPVQIVARTKEPRPYTCPKCGQRAVYPLYQCHACGKVFVPNLVTYEDEEFPEQYPAIPVVPSCSTCGSTNVGAYIGQEPVAADQLVLPPWP